MFKTLKINDALKMKESELYTNKVYIENQIIQLESLLDIIEYALLEKSKTLKDSYESFKEELSKPPTITKKIVNGKKRGRKKKVISVPETLYEGA